MKTATRQRGSVIIACLLVALVVAVLCGSYMASVISDYRYSLRSLKANSALNMAEAGIDAAMFDLKQKTVPSNNWSTVYDTDGTTVKFYYKTVINNRDLGAGDKGKVSVIIDSPTTTPSITAQGTISHPGSADIIKQVKVVLKLGGEGSLAGVYSKNTINMNGQNVVFDAYDSALGDYGVDVAVGTVPKAGTLVNNKNITDAITVAVLNPNASIAFNKNTILGKVSFAGSSTTGVGTSPSPTKQEGHFSDRVTWQYDNGNGGTLYGASDHLVALANKKMPGYFNDSRVVPNLVYTIPAALPKPDISTCTQKSMPAQGTTLHLGSALDAPKAYRYYNLKGDGDAQNENVSLDGNTSIQIDGPTVLVIDGALKISGDSPGIKIVKSANASLILFVKNNINITGKGIANDNYEADRFYMIPTGNSGQNIALAGNGTFRGVFFGPDFNVNINGNAAWYGAVVANAISIDGCGGFHFDVQCGKLLAGDSGYSIKQWIELTNTGGTTYARDTRIQLK